jgi:hypothetical protein
MEQSPLLLWNMKIHYPTRKILLPGHSLMSYNHIPHSPLSLLHPLPLPPILCNITHIYIYVKFAVLFVVHKRERREALKQAINHNALMKSVSQLTFLSPVKIPTKILYAYLISNSATCPAHHNHLHCIILKILHDYLSLSSL